MSNIMPFICGGFAVLTIPAVIVFVLVRASKRSAARQESWRQMAQRWNATFDGNRIQLPGTSGTLTLHVQLVSVMQAARSPLYRDGGTFTVATLHAQHPIAEGGPLAMDRVMDLNGPREGGVADIMSAAEHGGSIILDGNQAWVVYDGSVTDGGALDAAFRALAAISQVASAGPLRAIR